MKKITIEDAPQFGMHQFLKAIIPAYFAPLLSAGIPAWFLEKDELLHASYSTIALPSLVATILSFFMLAHFQKKQVFLFPKLAMALLLGLVMGLLFWLVTRLIGLQSEAPTVCFSAFIGAVIVSLTRPLKKIKQS